MLLIAILGLSLGFLGLYLGAKYVVISLENIANIYGISHLLVGLTILSIGTSLPEIAISVIGGIDKLTGIDSNIDGIVIGNKVGSFITNITLILGILGLTQSIFISKWTLRREGAMLFVSLFIFFLCAMDGVLTQFEGALMMGIYVVYLLFIIWSEKRIEKKQNEIKRFLAERDGIDLSKIEKKPNLEEIPSIRKNLLIFTLGLAILLASAEATILCAHELSNILNIPENVVGILIIGFGTSLPELIADLTALKREAGGIAVGDILGSNICDILFATGSGSVIAQFNVPAVILLYDLPMLFLGICLAYYFLTRENTLKLWESGVLIGFYGFYALMKLMYFQI